jgi:hypothetical protein
MENKSGEEEQLREANEKRGRKAKPRTYSRYVLPSDRHTFRVHFEVMRRFVTLSRNGAEAVRASRVEGEGVPIQAASMNVRFLRDIGLLTVRGRGQYVPTPEAIRFVNALSVGQNRAAPILRALVAPTWFAELAESLFATRPVMSEDDFISELALAAETDKSVKEPALRVILEYLVYTGIVERDEKGLSLAAKASTGEALRPTHDSSATEGMAQEVPGWHILQTEDFYVKVRSDPDAFQDLKDYLEPLERKLWRLHQKNSPKTEKGLDMDLADE